MFGQGNRFWEKRSRHGIKPTFPEGEEGARMLLEACTDYFTWAEDTPLMEEKLFSFEGIVTTHDTPRIQALTIIGLCLFIDISSKTWRDWRTSRPDLGSVIEWAEDTIRQQKFVAAAAGFLNANIISRDLGLADKTEISGPNGGPVETIGKEMTTEEAADAYARTREASKR